NGNTLRNAASIIVEAVQSPRRKQITVVAPSTSNGWNDLNDWNRLNASYSSSESVRPISLRAPLPRCICPPGGFSPGGIHPPYAHLWRLARHALGAILYSHRGGESIGASLSRKAPVPACSETS